MNEILARLDTVIAERRGGDPQSSYVARLCNDGIDRILKKIAEECGETMIAAKNVERGGDRDELVRETADLWFHCLVMLAALGGSSAEVGAELERRFGLSGIAEKAARGSDPARASE